MTFYVESETDRALPFDAEEVAGKVIAETLECEKCHYEVSLNILLTDNDGIHELNRQHRGIDRPTDVLSFPMLTYDSPSDFSCAETEAHGCFHSDTGELLLGDIIISMEKVREQAKKYGHSEEREYAFLIAHSMLHLCGYDHMEPEEAKEMEDRQSAILRSLNILR